MIQIMAFVAATMSPPVFMNDPKKFGGFEAMTRRGVGRFSIETVLKKPVCACSIPKENGLLCTAIRDGRSVHVTISNGDPKYKIFSDKDFIIECVGEK